MSITPPREFQGAGVPFTGGLYRAYGLRVVDGDTIDIIIDLGLDVYRTERVRVAGVDTPELRASDPAVRAKAIEAKAFTAAHTEGRLFTVRTYKSGDEKYGRYLADVLLPDGMSLAALLIATELGVSYLPS